MYPRPQKTALEECLSRFRAQGLGVRGLGVFAAGLYRSSKTILSRFCRCSLSEACCRTIWRASPGVSQGSIIVFFLQCCKRGLPGLREYYCHTIVIFDAAMESFKGLVST